MYKINENKAQQEKLEALITEVKGLQRLIAEGDTADVAEYAFSFWKQRQAILGGNATTIAKMDEFDREYAKVRLVIA